MANSDVLDRQIFAYNAMRDESGARRHLYEWVVFHDEQLVDTYEDFRGCRRVKRFGSLVGDAYPSLDR